MNILELFNPIRAFVFDIDGVLTDGMLFVPENGELLRQMNIKDGYALQLAIKKGYQVWVISGGQSTAAQQRLHKLGVTEVYIGVSNKEMLLRQKCEEHRLPLDQVLYMGDDMPDLAPMKICGLPSCPADAAQDIRLIARYISAKGGGSGCVRDVIEKVLKINGDWE